MRYFEYFWEILNIIEYFNGENFKGKELNELSVGNLLFFYIIF